MKQIILVSLVLFVGLAQSEVVRWSVDEKHAHKITSFKNAARLSSKIVGGQFADYGQFPWQVGVYLDGTGFCGGTLISDTVVLTAAQCVDRTRIFTLHFGTVDIEERNETAQIIDTRNGIKHDFYDSQILLNDIGLIILSEPVVGEFIGTIRLPSRSMVGDTLEGVVGTAIGWGRPSDSESQITKFLKFVNLDIISNADCAAFYGEIINDSKLCVATKAAETGTCLGDSGGPLIITEADGEMTEVAITSFLADEGCEAGFPDGFTRITEYLDWIEENAGVTIRP